MHGACAPSAWTTRSYKRSDVTKTPREIDIPRTRFRLSATSLVNLPLLRPPRNPSRSLLSPLPFLFLFCFESKRRCVGGEEEGTDRPDVSGKTESGNSCDGRISRVRETRSLHTWILGDTRKSYVKLFLLRYLVNSGERAATPLAISRNIRN